MGPYCHHLIVLSTHFAEKILGALVLSPIQPTLYVDRLLQVTVELDRAWAGLLCSDVAHFSAEQWGCGLVGGGVPGVKRINASMVVKGLRLWRWWWAGLVKYVKEHLTHRKDSNIRLTPGSWNMPSCHSLGSTGSKVFDLEGKQVIYIIDHGLNLW